MFKYRSDEITKFTTAFVAFQSEVKPVYKNEKGRFGCAKLETLLEAALPLLSKNGLSIDQSDFYHEGHIFLRTCLTHISGEFKASYDYLYPFNFLTPESQQKAGIIKTYQCRYSVKNFLGIPTPDPDIDDPVTKDQAKELYEYYKDLPILEDAFLDKFDIDNSFQLPANRYHLAKQFLTLGREKVLSNKGQ